MNKLEQYDFSDSIFQLELNLHNIRRELIYMIEEFEKKDCFSCLQLKCRCLVESPEKNNYITSLDVSGHRSKESTPNKAPSADFLPKPKFEREVDTPQVFKEGNRGIEAWVESSRNTQKSKADQYLSADMLLALKKSWNDSRGEIKKEMVLEEFKKERNILDMRNATNAVEVFFNRFKQPAASTANLNYITNVAAIYGNQKSRSSGYTYF